MKAEAGCRPDRQRGATAVEYALLVALIAGVIVAAIVTLGPVVQDLYTRATQGW